MSDILFKCPKCTKSLTVNDRITGEMVKCVDCSHSIRVPIPHITFSCPSCQNPFATSAQYSGSMFVCCDCQSNMTVPEIGVKPVTSIQEAEEKQKNRENETVHRGVVLPTLDDNERKRMIKNMFDRNDKFTDQLKKAKEPKLIRLAKRILQYAIVTFWLWFLTWLFNDKIASIVLGISIGVEVFILVCEMVLFKSVYE